MERYALGFICLQGGGLYIYGTATLTNTNVYSNTARNVRARLLNLPRRFLHRPNGTLCAAFFGLQSGGVFVDSNGVANFESCNIHDNTARNVRLHL